jgi:predicted HTH transcriptional regulator
MSFGSIKTILDNHAYESLIGLEEDTWLEAKGRNPYDFTTPGGRYELAKDVSAFANADGGILIVGLTTILLPSAKTERITAHDFCTQEEFSVEQYQGLIKEHVYPAIKDLRIYWSPANPEATHGLGVIEAPAQSPNHKYFLTAKVIESGSQIKQIVFGVAKRIESSNDPLSISELHKNMQSGKNPVPQTLARVEEKLDQLLHDRMTPTEVILPPEEIYAERAARILDEDAQ